MCYNLYEKHKNQILTKTEEDKFPCLDFGFFHSSLKKLWINEKSTLFNREMSYFLCIQVRRTLNYYHTNCTVGYN